MGYIIVAPGMKVGEVGEADVIPRDNPKLAVAYALARSTSGWTTSIWKRERLPGRPEEMIAAVRSAIDIPLLVGGSGIRTGDRGQGQEAGASVVVTGPWWRTESSRKGSRTSSRR